MIVCTESFVLWQISNKAMYLFIDTTLVHQSHDVRKAKSVALLVFEYRTVNAYEEHKVKIRCSHNHSSRWRVVSLYPDQYDYIAG